MFHNVGTCQYTFVYWNNVLQFLLFVDEYMDVAGVVGDFLTPALQDRAFQRRVTTSAPCRSASSAPSPISAQ